MNAQATKLSNGETSLGGTILTLLFAGAASIIVWEVWARLIAPIWIGGPLEPAGLVQAVFGLSNRTIAEVIHFATGLIAYPFGYIFIARPIAKAVFPSMPWWVVALAYGAALWVFALYFMAHLAAGFPAFLGFQPIAWASLVGHLLFALAGGAVVKARLG